MNMKTRGRPSVPVTWPEGEFSVADLIGKFKCSRVSLQAKVNKAVASGQIVDLGLVTGRAGRPRRKFQKASGVPVPVAPKAPPAGNTLAELVAPAMPTEPEGPKF